MSESTPAAMRRRAAIKADEFFRGLDTPTSLATKTCLQCEDQQQFVALCVSLIDKFQPGDYIQATLVQHIAVTQWRVQRMSIAVAAGAKHGLRTDHIAKYKARLSRLHRRLLKLLRDIQEPVCV